MMYHTWKIFQMTAKTLFRSKAFLSVVFIVPVLATLILNFKDTGDEIQDNGGIINLDEMDVQVAYLNDYSMLPIKVYDESDSKIVDYLLDELYQTNLIQIYRADASNVSIEEVKKSIELTTQKDKVSAIIVINRDIEQQILAGNVDGVELIRVGNDERYCLLESQLKLLLEKYALLGIESDSVEELEKQILESQPDETIVETIESSENEIGMDVDYEKTGMFAGTLAILSLSFMVSGVLILNTILKERQNLVFTRIMLTKSSNLSYLLAKFSIIFITSLVQTGVSVAANILFVSQDIGISNIEFAFIIFLLGFLFNTMSVCIGIYVGSTVTSIYISFIVWMCSALLGGMYFDISNATENFQRIAMLMPQRWGLMAAAMFMKGNYMAYPMLLIVTLAILIVIMIAGIIGLRLNRKE